MSQAMTTKGVKGTSPPWTWLWTPQNKTLFSSFLFGQICSEGSCKAKADSIGIEVFKVEEVLCTSQPTVLSKPNQILHRYNKQCLSAQRGHGSAFSLALLSQECPHLSSHDRCEYMKSACKLLMKLMGCFILLHVIQSNVSPCTEL